jgi:hypothetical protein
VSTALAGTSVGHSHLRFGEKRFQRSESSSGPTVAELDERLRQSVESDAGLIAQIAERQWAVPLDEHGQPQVVEIEGTGRCAVIWSLGAMLKHTGGESPGASLSLLLGRDLARGLAPDIGVLIMLLGGEPVALGSSTMRTIAGE